MLAPDGLLLVSTPDKDLYSEAAGQVNDVPRARADAWPSSGRCWARASSTWRCGGSARSRARCSARLDAGAAAGASARSSSSSRRAGSGSPSQEPAPLFCVALASRRRSGSPRRLDARRHHARAAPQGRGRARRRTPRGGPSATGCWRRPTPSWRSKRREALAVAERRRAGSASCSAQGDELWELRVELDGGAAVQRRVEESVSWQTFQRARARLYGRSARTRVAGRALRPLLRAVGRLSAAIVESRPRCPRRRVGQTSRDRMPMPDPIPASFASLGPAVRRQALRPRR